MKFGRRRSAGRGPTESNLMASQVGDDFAHEEIANSVAVQFDSLERLTQLFDRLHFVISNAQAVSFILFGDLRENGRERERR